MTHAPIVGQLALAILALLFDGACGSSAPLAASEITGLHFTTSSQIPENPPPVVDVTLTDPTPVRTIYTATLALPVYPPGTYNCPSDPGVRYSIDFTGGPNVATTAVLNPAGCDEVTITGSATRRNLDPGYWAALAQNLGIQESTIYPYVPPKMP